MPKVLKARASKQEELPNEYRVVQFLQKGKPSWWEFY